MALASPKLKLPNTAEQVAFRAVDQILRKDPVLQTTVKAWRSWQGVPEDILAPTFPDLSIPADQSPPGGLAVGDRTATSDAAEYHAGSRGRGQ